ncbi:MAG: cbb3-type cytochrome c oxidase subunit I [Candidatus Saccharimonadales bacterium]
MGTLTFALGGLAVVLLITALKRWRWLWREWLTTLDPKRIGVMYLVVAAAMLLRGLADASMMRAQQAFGSQDALLSSEHFQQVFTAHGTIMIFFVAMGVIFALFNLVIPLIIGARDVAFPFLNATSFWLFAAGALLVNLFLLVGGEFSGAGWLAYPPLSGLEFSPGPGVDYWIWALQIAGVGSLLSGINFLVTIFKMRAPGMRLMQMPMLVWATLGALVLIVFAFPILTATLGMLSLDRLLGMHFFTTDLGGNAMLYVNFIWAWGHPEVYILILPAFGIFSEVVATLSRKRLFGYVSMVWAIVAITFLSFIVWVHHFFTMGAGANVNAFFGIMTMIIAVPTGVKVFNWLFTMYRGRVHFDTPMLWFLGFVVTFTLGGVAGVMMSVPAIDFQVHNSLFLVAHFHTMIIGGVLFGSFAGFTYWWPKFTGFRLHEGLGKAAFWCWLVGFLLAFVPLYILGLMGATRRLDYYDPSQGWQGLFIVAGVGLVTILIGVGLQMLQVGASTWLYLARDNTAPGKVLRALRRLFGSGHKLAAGNDPWDGRTLEWSTTSPPPYYDFAKIPEVHGRDAFWAAKHAKKEKPVYEPIRLPKNTPLGMFIAAGAFMVGFGLIWHLWWLAGLGLLVVIGSIIARSNAEETEYTVLASEVAKFEARSNA